MTRIGASNEMIIRTFADAASQIQYLTAVRFVLSVSANGHATVAQRVDCRATDRQL
jgi:hypothetical protein